MSFIHQFTINDLSICDKLIDYHKNNIEYKKEGMTQNASGKIQINKDIKDSIDVTFWAKSQNKVIQDYFQEIQKGLNKYIEKYQALRLIPSMKILDSNVIQYYPPNGGFKTWHYERMGANYPQVSRILVYMTYLNDVTDEGETEWGYQNIKIQPKKGLSVIWPADFTHMHKGIPSKTQEKYITTGWFNLI
jgi:hypothetical protein|tara:strand:- start:32 stop:601 length:570 start_codon:yes stop_codon:yes gene_type:complete